MHRHPMDLMSFVPGLVFVGIAVVTLADGLTLDLLTAEWVWPVVLILLGVGVLASAGRRRGGAAEPVDAADHDAEPEGPATPAE